jgi:transketolase
MRDTFIATLAELARADPRVMLITGDLGFGVLGNFAKELPEQFLNAGVAEQNMTGLATGLALEGRKAFTYSIGNFPTLRALEQIRNDAAYHEANVTAVAIGGGFSYGPLGMSHHATEDLAILRALPQVSVFSPGCLWEVEQIVRAIVRQPRGTCYLRLDKSNAGNTRREGETFAIGRARQLTSGSDAALFVTGGILAVGLEAAKRLKSAGIGVSVFSVHTLNELGAEGLDRYPAIFTLEEHVVRGGLGGLVAETCLEQGARPKVFHRFGLRGGFQSIVGSQEYLRTRHGLDADAVVARIAELLRASGPRP